MSDETWGGTKEEFWGRFNEGRVLGNSISQHTIMIDSAISAHRYSGGAFNAFSEDSAHGFMRLLQGKYGGALELKSIYKGAPDNCYQIGYISKTSLRVDKKGVEDLLFDLAGEGADTV